jgi:hypothetical protein
MDAMDDPSACDDSLGKRYGRDKANQGENHAAHERTSPTSSVDAHGEAITGHWSTG